MPLTLEQAATAGDLATKIAAANAEIADIDTRIAEDIPFVRVSADRVDGSSISTTLNLDVDTSNALLGVLKTMLEAKRDAAQDALDAITIAA